MSSQASIGRALLYLRAMTFAGSIKSRLKRLRQPKYLAGAVVGVAYFYFIFAQRSQAPRRGSYPGMAERGPPPIPTEAFSLFAELGTLLLLLVLIVNWVIPRRASLAFSEAEIAFLFPAPASRRSLIHYKLLSAQLGIAFASLILTLAFGRGSGLVGHPIFYAIGWWLVLATLNLHFMGTAFFYSRLLNRSVTSGRQKAVRIGVALAVVAALVGWALSSMQPPRPENVENLTTVAAYIASQLHAGPMPWLLAVPRLLIAPYQADTSQQFLLALGPALGVLIAHYFWVLYTAVSFEEASIARAEKRGARLRAVQQGDWRGQRTTHKARQPPFKLRDTGPPATAFLWKNLLSTSAFFRPKIALAVAVIVLAGGQWLARQPEGDGFRAFLMVLSGFLLAITVILGPMIVRHDLRADLSNSDILKTYPLRGWQIVLGELLTPLVILTVLTGLCVLAAFLLVPADRFMTVTASMRLLLALGLLVIAPPFIAIQLLIVNAATIVFPAWAQMSGNQAERGIEVLGQRLIFIAGQLLITVIAVIPSAIIGSVVFVIAQWLAGFEAAAILTIATVCVLLTAEAWLGVRWLGMRFEQFDLSTELRP